MALTDEGMGTTMLVQPRMYDGTLRKLRQI